MNGQEEFRELEFALKSMPEKQLAPKAFKSIHGNLLEEANRLGRNDRRMKIFKKSMWGIAGVAALFLFVFIGLSLPMSSTSQQESAKVAHDSDGAYSDAKEDASTVLLSLELVEESLRTQGLEINNAERIEENIFHQDLNRLEPVIYNLSEGQISVYVFQNEYEVDSAANQFNESTATMNLIGYQIYKSRNVLMFYAGRSDEINAKIDQAVREMTAFK
ncbi:hypothetical protein AM500_23625 [Bacillus sp. FJAT-18017]|uniref:hypothetical protein n=1 Tax=Bacillus sp. FJAT-18017 TaxID=1705566 RepID=UPI0006AFF962|nr:hypothetical protein [Bacillus sp. FJAT-18017]ALC92420.1 hypothetical protein AM500_23625 [Bacillus sp. FJAT-18017]